MPNKIIAVTGPHEGVGKSTLAVNLAAHLAQVRHQPVILIDADRLCRGETAQVAAAAASAPNVTQLVDQLLSKQVSLPMLRGRLPLNRMQIGVMNLAPQARDAQRLTPDQWRFFLQSFSEIFDIVVDIEVSSDLAAPALDVAEAIVWTFLPNALSIRSTLHELESLQSQKFDFAKFLFVLNQAGLPQALPQEAVEQMLERFDRALDGTLPFEPELVRLLNEGHCGVLDAKRSPYTQRVIHLAEQLGRLQRNASSRPASSFPLTGNGENGGVPSSRGEGGARGPVTQTTVVNRLLGEKHDRWNKTKTRLHRDLVEEMNIRRIDLDTKGDPVRERQLRTHVESTVNALIGKEKDLPLAREEREQLARELVDEALGLGPLEELLRDPSITEIMVNRFDQVYIERRGKITLSDKRFIDNNHVVQVVRRIIAPLGRRIDESMPMVDARLKDGSRVNAIIPPLAVQGPSITIRRFPEKAFSAADILAMGSISQPMIDFLKVCVLAKKNIIISGGTGTGKTTILNMLSSFIPNDERIVTVEDTAELRLQQEHIVRLEARPPNIEGHGQVTIRELVKNCLRMRPDRIVVGECRAGEALDMLQAMNTGHDGSLTTIHANSPRDTFTRLETLCLMAGMDLPVWALREQIRSAVHVIVQLSRLQDGSRKVTCITEVIGRDEESILTQDLFRYVQDRVDESGNVLGHYETTDKRPTFSEELKTKGLM